MNKDIHNKGLIKANSVGKKNVNTAHKTNPKKWKAEYRKR